MLLLFYLVFICSLFCFVCFVVVLWGAGGGGGFLFLQEREKERERTPTRKNVFWKDCSLG